MKSATKNEVDSFVRSLGGSTSYSGKTKTMYISTPVDSTSHLRYLLDEVRRKFLDFSFTLKTNTDATQKI